MLASILISCNNFVSILHDKVKLLNDPIIYACFLYEIPALELLKTSNLPMTCLFEGN
jgi:hypothetical protein